MNPDKDLGTLPSLSALPAARLAPTAGPVAVVPADHAFYKDRAFVRVENQDRDIVHDAAYLTDTFVFEWRKYVANPSPNNYHVFGEPVWWSASLDDDSYTFVNMPAIGGMGLEGHGRDAYGQTKPRVRHTFPKVDSGATGRFEISAPYPVHVKWFYSQPDLFLDVSFRDQRARAETSYGAVHKDLVEEYHSIFNAGAEHKTRNRENGQFRAPYCALVAIDFVEASKRIRVCGQIFYSAKGDKPPEGAGRAFFQGRADPSGHQAALEHLLNRCPFYDLGKELEGFAPGTRGHAQHLQHYEQDFEQ